MSPERFNVGRVVVVSIEDTVPSSAVAMTVLVGDAVVPGASVDCDSKGGAVELILGGMSSVEAVTGGPGLRHSYNLGAMN